MNIRRQGNTLNGRRRSTTELSNGFSKSGDVFKDSLPLRRQTAVGSHMINDYYVNMHLLAVSSSIYTTRTIKIRRLSVTEVGAAGWAWSTHATVAASQEQTLSGRGARVYTRTCVHDNILCKRLPK